ncbi:hypothetical protein PsorP6_012779 [Peronosclerospora sorghi]|uniref:Uncharacterized protein n=1 Tax=Peronosclerospora sorghi TaxID=230839 RepID=A0ACC0WGH3_9STRA|nr:hypothetical protein PsorP6_012779 [Peronosclerospora sorghi]
MLEVDLLALAKVATRVKMPYLAMQYVEMWLEKENGGKFVTLSSLKNDEVVTTLRSILVDACLFDSADGDDIYGVIDGRTVQSQLVKFNFEREYAKAISLYDVLLRFVTSNVQDIGHSMHDGNSVRVVESYLESMPWTNDMTSQGFSQTQQHKYELAWKSMQWEAVLPGLSTPRTEEAWRNKTSGENVLVLHKQRTIFGSLRAIAHEEYSRFHDVVAHAKTQLLRSIQLNLHSFESSRDLHSSLVHFQAIREIEEMATQIEKDQRGRTTSRVEDDKSVEAREAHPLFTKWQDQIAQVENEFDKAESLLSLEEVLLLMSKTSDRTQVLINLYLDLASLSLKAGRTAVVYRALLNLEHLDQRGW